jgi:hypothetical protein
MKISKKQQRREEARALQAARPRMSEELIQASKLAAFPLVRGWLSEGYQKSGLAICGLARRRPDGDLAILTAITDLGCMGTKDFKLLAKVPPSMVGERFERYSDTPLEEAPVGHVVQVLREAMRWRIACGMPAREAHAVVTAFLDTAQGDPTYPVTLGTEGKPFLIPGPFDDAEELIGLLEAKFGPTGFHYITPVS